LNISGNRASFELDWGATATITGPTTIGSGGAIYLRDNSAFTGDITVARGGTLGTRSSFLASLGGTIDGNIVNYGTLHLEASALHVVGNIMLGAGSSFAFWVDSFMPGGGLFPMLTLDGHLLNSEGQMISESEMRSVLDASSFRDFSSGGFLSTNERVQLIDTLMVSWQDNLAQPGAPDTVVPAPATLLILGLAGAGALGMRTLRRKSQRAGDEA